MTRPAAAGSVNTEVAGSVATVVICNPAKRNAMSAKMMRALGETLTRLDGDPGIRVIVLRGCGHEAFTAGADISYFEARPGSDDVRRAIEEAADVMLTSISSLGTPLIAMISGYCIGAGVAVALGADIRIAAEGSSFAIPAARLGLGYPVSLTHALVHVVGPAHASEVLLTGRRLTGPEALAAGLITRLVPASDLEPEVMDTAAAIAANAPLSVRASKAAIRSYHNPEREESARRLAAQCVHSQDALEGQRAFRERRPPEFKGC